MKRIISIILVLSLAFALVACGDKNGEQSENLPSQNPNRNDDRIPDGGTVPPDDGNGGETDAPPQSADFAQTDEDMFTNRDAKADYDESRAIKIELYGTSAAASDKSVVIKGTSVTITKEGTYLISGTLSDGQITVNLPETDKAQLVLRGVDITSKTSAALYVVQADKVFVTLEGESTLQNGGSFENTEETNIDGAVFSKEDLTFNGGGKLTVLSSAGHGIVCKDDLVFVGGEFVVTSACHGVDANDSVRIKDTAFTLNSGKDGIHCENTDDSSKGFVYISSASLSAVCDGDGIDAGAYLHIVGGNFEIKAGGGYENGSKQSSDSWGNMPGGGGGRFPGGMRPREQGNSPVAATSDTGTGMKGLKANLGILICSGTFDINSADDGIHSDSDLTLDGGIFGIASGDDGIHAENTLTVTAGEINISQSYEGIEGLHIRISGGEITLKADDDGLNAAGGVDNSGLGGRDNMFGNRPGGMGSGNGSITISGGTVNITASGDGIDANGTLEITGGYTTVTGPTQGDTAVLDYDKTATISGGTFVGTGSSMMAQSLSSSAQGVIAISTGSRQAGTEVKVTDKDGNVLLSHAPALNYQIAIFSSPRLVKGESYTVSVGSQTAQVEAN